MYCVVCPAAVVSACAAPAESSSTGARAIADRLSRLLLPHTTEGFLLLLAWTGLKGANARLAQALDDDVSILLEDGEPTHTVSGDKHSFVW